MNEGRFDELTRALAANHVSRGQVLKVLAASMLGGTLGSWGVLGTTKDAAGLLLASALTVVLHLVVAFPAHTPTVPSSVRVGGLRS
jgi:hypothetical protein